MIYIKIFGVLFLSSVLLFVHTIVLPFILLFLLWMYSNTKNRIKPLLIIFSFIILFQLLFNTTISIEQRLYQGVFAGSRIIALSLLVFWFTETTAPSKIIQAFSFLPPQIRLMLTISLSLIPVLMKEIGAIERAQLSRGKSTIFSIIIPLLHRTLKRSEQIAIVLQTRGYENLG